MKKETAYSIKPMGICFTGNSVSEPSVHIVPTACARRSIMLALQHYAGSAFHWQQDARSLGEHHEH